MQMDHAALEAAFVDQLEVQAEVGTTRGDVTPA